MKFCQLHIHNMIGSILDGMSDTNDYAKKAKEYGHEYLACTDHGRLMALYEHQKSCLKNEIKPIHGIEMYTTNHLIYEEEGKRKREKTNHLILLAKNKEGYNSLLKLNYISNKDKDHFYYSPRVLDEEIFENKNGLIVGTACMGSKFGRLIIDGKIEESEKEFKKYLDVFKDDFYAEVQLNEITNRIDQAEFGQKTINDYIISFANKYGVPIVMTGDVHYLNPGDDKLQTISMAIKNGDTIDNITFELEAKNLYYHDTPDYIKFNKEFEYGYKESDIISWCENSYDIAKKCNFLIPERTKVNLPTVTEDDDQALIKKAKAGLHNLFNGEIPEEYTKRLNYELEIIIRKGFSNYILILDDIYSFIKSNDEFYYGPGRGCFTPENLVSLPNKEYKKIKDIKVGDIVISGYGNEKEVINKFEFDIDEEIIEIETEKGIISLTKDHKVMVIEKGKEINTDNIFWLEAQYITDEFLLNIKNKNSMEIIKIKEIRRRKYKGKVYDLTIKDDFAYKVNDATVHNSAAGSLVLYSMGLTTLDPIKYGLIFERFMSESRTPDVVMNYFCEDMEEKI